MLTFLTFGFFEIVFIFVVLYFAYKAIIKIIEKFKE